MDELTYTGIIATLVFYSFLLLLTYVAKGGEIAQWLIEKKIVFWGCVSPTRRHKAALLISPFVFAGTICLLLSLLGRYQGSSVPFVTMSCMSLIFYACLFYLAFWTHGHRLIDWLKNKRPAFWGIHAQPSRRLKIFLALVPFIVLVCVYLSASNYRHSINPSDKLLPTVGQMYDTTKRVTTEPDKRTGEYQLWVDTLASLKRIGIAMALTTMAGMFMGLNIGMLPGIRALSLPFLIFLSIIPPLAILPILFIAVGVDELAKVVLIFFGTVFFVTRDIYAAVVKIPKEQIVKALTLGGSQFRVCYRVVFPQTVPRLIDSVRLQMGGAWLFLIASEAIAATSGLGYRIFLVRRYLAMDMIIPYVIWIVIIGFTVDLCLQKLIQKKYRWYAEMNK